MRLLGAFLATLFAAAFLAGSANAKTADGTIITNVASATYYASNLSVEYSVSYSTTVYVVVAGPDLQMRKDSNPTSACSGGTVTFCIFAVNMSGFTSAFNVELTDELPIGFSYLAGQEIWSIGSVTPGYMTTAGTCPPSCVETWGVEPSTGQTSLSGKFWIKWAIDTLGPYGSAMICFKVTLL